MTSPLAADFEEPDSFPPGADASLRGVIRYDSALHTADELARMSDTVRAAVARAPAGASRLVITQTHPWPDDSPADRRALITALHGLRLVES